MGDGGWETEDGGGGTGDGGRETGDGGRETEDGGKNNTAFFNPPEGDRTARREGSSAAFHR